MKYLLILSVLMVGCGPAVLRDPSSDGYMKYCNTLCQKKYGTDVSQVGYSNGACYCK